MQRATSVFTITDFITTKQQLLHWANQYSSCSFLDNNQYTSSYNSVECLVGVGVVNEFALNTNDQEALKTFLSETSDWLFGHVGYDYKEGVNYSHINECSDNIGFAPIYFFQPEIVILLSINEIEIQSLTALPISIFEEINRAIITKEIPANPKPSVQARISRDAYLSIIQQIKQHILRGDCYEINFCQEFFATDAHINPLLVYQQLLQLSPNPFSCYYKLEDKHLLCASPERYMKKTGSQLLSQPIKGTFKRDTSNFNTDNLLKQQLFESSKERAENVMVVDLVRNDLSKICKESSVNVTELFGIYTFPQVHQMISTIVGEVEDHIDFADILEATFPMGSMTGTPKKRVMELINQYEVQKRGLYSGAVGYITPKKDFDFNVVIRSILYNSTNKYLSYQVGSGITHYSDAESEYEECLLKAKSMKRVLE